MTVRIAINGYGRIGQCILRALYEAKSANNGQSLSKELLNEKLQVVAINELSDIDTIAYLTRYDSTHGRFAHQVSVEANQLLIDDDRINIYREQEISKLPWDAENIDVVMDCTGVFGSRAQAELHIRAGAKRVLFSHPAESDVDKTIDYGLNHEQLSDKDRIVSNASCTTNAIVPVLDALNTQFGIQAGVMTTIHSAMNDQPVIDAYHHRDLRRTRSAMHNMVPVETALAKGVERLLPELKGKLSAVAMRVPTVNVSALDLSLQLSKKTTTDEINEILKQAADSNYSGVLAYTQEPLASSDFNHDLHSGIVDGSQTRLAMNTLAKVLIWFDNEWGFANRMLDVTGYWFKDQA